ncbi:hypothetical protein [Sphingosinicella sp. CPCC 101087]|uniref:hypothetical protein n=1 Tax=Sphingosinicella sp. CPCC 101087 TaxID=2497754 RepID=UPI00101B813C|nr:hypothetical protein [Sphingosinicella sp. CPCC 101087]
MFAMILSAAALSVVTASPAANFPPREAPAAATDAAPACPNLAPRYADEGWVVRSRPRRLIELPPGRLELAVHRVVDGCPVPAVLRDGIGGAPADVSRR